MSQSIEIGSMNLFFPLSSIEGHNWIDLCHKDLIGLLRVGCQLLSATYVFFIKLSHKYVFSHVFVHLSIYYALSNFLNLFLGRSDGLGVKFLFSGLSSCFLDL